jgi:hypothetical protein
MRTPDDDDANLLFQCTENMEMVAQIPLVAGLMFGLGRKIELAE